MRNTLPIAALGVALTFYSVPATAATVTVHVVSFDFTATGVGGAHFDPTINVGDTVHWTWDAPHHSTHSVAGSAETWDSGIQANPFTFDHVFTNAGDFSYYCAVHGSDNGNGTASGMSGIVHVLAPLPNSYTQTNLVSDLANQASHQDVKLVNAWGLDKTPTGPWWVNSAGKGLSLLYNGTGVANTLVVTIPPPSGGTPPSSPTGIVYNPTTSFQIAPSRPGVFLFATEDGTLSGWNAGVDQTHAVIKVNRNGSAIYKGLAIAQRNGQNVLYAANFFGGVIEAFDASFNMITLSPTAFKDAAVPAGYGPFNVQTIANKLYVTWAKQDPNKKDDVPGPGLGYVTVFSPAGTVVGRLQHGNFMNAPWGIALAPSNFGALSNMLLVGQFGNGTIAAFDATTLKFKSLMKRPNAQTLAISGLWGISFGNGGSAGATNALYFAAGISGETHGLFGSITTP